MFCQMDEVLIVVDFTCTTNKPKNQTTGLKCVTSEDWLRSVPILFVSDYKSTISGLRTPHCASQRNQVVDFPLSTFVGRFAEICSFIFLLVNNKDTDLKYHLY